MSARIFKILLGFVILSGICLVSAYLLISFLPSAGAQGADLLRTLVGDRPVVVLERTYFRIQDSIEGTKYTLGLEVVEAPWEIVSTLDAEPEGLQTLTPSSTPVVKELEDSTMSESQHAGTAAPTNGNTIPTLSPTPNLPTETPTPTEWAPGVISSSGTLGGEGVWSSYFRNPSGEIIAYRTFVQPDPERPYSVVAIVAIDLAKTRLNFVLGFEEPYNPDAPIRSGRIPDEDMRPGTLLAAFNGGFKAQHGQSGAMAGGLEVLPPRDGLGTVAMYADGSLRMGEWGAELEETEDMVSWRQNGPLVVQDGEINPRIYNNDPKDWGYTVDDVSPTLRSGLGVSQDGSTLYYLAGPKLTMEALAKSMISGGVYDGIQLDINNYWVHFVVYPAEMNELAAEPLLPDLMIENFDRYLDAFGRDYFYLTPRE